MQHHVTVAVRHHAARVRNAHAAEHDGIARPVGMHVETRTDTHHLNLLRRARTQDGGGERQIVGRRDLDVIRAPGDQSRPLTAPFDGLGFVGGRAIRIERGFERAQQHTAAEHLRSRGAPQRRRDRLSRRHA